MAPGSALALLACPGRRRLFSRHGLPELFQIRCPSANRGRRECRVHAAPAVSCAKSCAFGAHEHTGQRKHSDIPCATALRLIRALPGGAGLLSPSPLRSLLLKRLTPASRRQDHTTWPYASAFSSGA